MSDNHLNAKRRACKPPLPQSFVTIGAAARKVLMAAERKREGKPNG